MMLYMTQTWILVILLNVQSSFTADVKAKGLLEPGWDCDLSRFLHYIIKHEGSIRDLEIKLEKQEKKNDDERKRYAEDLKRLERKQSEDQKKQAEDLKRLERKLGEDFAKMNTCKADMDKMARKHDEDLKQLKNDLEASKPCPPALPFKWRGHCYGIINLKLTYHGAQRHCRSIGADLVWIQDSTEQNFIEATFLRRKIFSWIGCNDIAHEGRFVWSHNNQVVTYFKWSGYPDNYGNNEDCCMLLHNRHWNDYPCNKALESFICKK